MLNDVIGYTSYESFLDIHLLPDSAQKLTKILSVFLWIAIAIVLGYSIGLITALLCRFTSNSSEEQTSDISESIRDIDNTLYSTDFAVMFLAPWIAYLLAEAFDISAILTIFFCGLSLGQYAIYNLSPSCRQVINRMTSLLPRPMEPYQKSVKAFLSSISGSLSTALVFSTKSRPSLQGQRN